MGKLSKDKRDIYYRLAKQNNYRSRAAYKLIQVDYHFNLLENSSLIVDLCAAPGGFSQVCSKRLKSKKSKKIISVDLQEIAPIEDVDILMGDITNQETLQKILELSENKKVDLSNVKFTNNLISKFINKNKFKSNLYINKKNETHK